MKSAVKSAESFAEPWTKTFFSFERSIHMDHYATKIFEVPCLLLEQGHLFIFVNKWLFTPLERVRIWRKVSQINRLGLSNLLIPCTAWNYDYRRIRIKKCNQKTEIFGNLMTAPPGDKSMSPKVSGNWKISWIDTKIKSFGFLDPKIQKNMKIWSTDLLFRLYVV